MKIGPKRKRVLIFYACIVVFLCLFFLPWVGILHNKTYHFFGFHPIWFSPRYYTRYINVFIDQARFFIELFVVTMVFCILFLLTREDSSKDIALIKKEKGRILRKLKNSDKQNKKEVSVALEATQELPLKTDQERLPKIKLPGMTWFYFYNYFTLPFSIIQNIADMQNYDSPLIVGIFILFSVFTGAVCYGLHKRKLWAWKLNMGLILFVTLMRFWNQSLVGATSEAFIWIVIGAVNCFYFKKRQLLFD